RSEVSLSEVTNHGRGGRRHDPAGRFRTGHQTRAGARDHAEAGARCGHDQRAAPVLGPGDCTPGGARRVDRCERARDRGAVGGGMTFAGGPFNHATLQALARMVQQLRAAPGTTGLLTCISGMITKHGMALWSTAPPSSGGFQFADVSATAEATTPVVELVEH